MKRLICLLFLLLLALTPIFAQHTVTGTVRDEKGDPMPFASVFTKNGVSTASTDAEGKYTISVRNDNAVLVFSFLGYLDKEVKVKGRNVIDVQFDVDSALFDEPVLFADPTVLAIPYGKTSKYYYPGSADHIISSKIENLPAINPLNILNGTFTGLRLTSPNGQPGSDASISIRGLGSIQGDTDPLIVLDGIVYEGFLSAIPISDIEEISILKDATATALYGAGAANGAIIITTKHEGLPRDAPRISARIAHGFVSREQKDYEVMDVKGYMESLWRQIYNSYCLYGLGSDESARRASASIVQSLGYNSDYHPWKGSVGIDEVVGLDGKYNPDAVMLWEDDTDWKGATERLGQVQDYGISASGGVVSKLGETGYFGSVNYLNSQGYMTGTAFERYSARLNVSFTKKWLTFGVNSSASISDCSGNLSTTEKANNNSFYVVPRIPPIYPVHLHNADGSFIYNAEGTPRYDFGIGYSFDGSYIPQRSSFANSNVAAYQEKNFSHKRRNIIDVHPFLEIEFLKEFNLKASTSVYNSDFTDHSAVPYCEDAIYSSSVSMSHTQTRVWVNNQLLTWKHFFMGSSLEALVGHETKNNTYAYDYVAKRFQIEKGDNYQLNNYSDISDADGYTMSGGIRSWFARLDYNYYKYTNLLSVTGSFRRDIDTGDSDYSLKNDYWSLGASLRIEDYMPFDMNRMQFRASAGSLIKTVGDSYGSGLIWDIAADFEGVDSRFSGSVEYFCRPTNDVVMQIISIQDLSLKPTSWKLVNKGWELALNYDVLGSRRLSWRLGTNASFIKNRLTDMPEGPYGLYSGLYKREEGRSIYELWLYQWKGVDPASGLNYFEPGDAYYKEDGSYVEGIADNPEIIMVDGEYYTKDEYKARRDYCGSTIPKVFGGISSDFSAGPFSLSINLYYQLGGKGYDSGYANLMHSGVYGNRFINRHVDAAKSWTQENPDADFAIWTDYNIYVGSISYRDNISAFQSTRWLISTNMLEINNITLSYEIPKKLCKAIGTENLKLFISADHLCLLNTRRGYYSNYSFSNYIGDSSIYKPARTVMMGINLTF